MKASKFHLSDCHHSINPVLVDQVWSFVRQESATRWTYSLLLPNNQKHFIEIDFLIQTWRKVDSGMVARPWPRPDGINDFGSVLMAIENQLTHP